MNLGEWVVISKVAGELQAELIRGLLEAQEIPVTLVQEGAGRAIGITTGPLGEVEILVPQQNARQSQEIISDYLAGKLEDSDSPAS